MRSFGSSMAININHNRVNLLNMLLCYSLHYKCNPSIKHVYYNSFATHMGVFRRKDQTNLINSGCISILLLFNFSIHAMLITKNIHSLAHDVVLPRTCHSWAVFPRAATLFIPKDIKQTNIASSAVSFDPRLHKHVRGIRLMLWSGLTSKKLFSPLFCLLTLILLRCKANTVNMSMAKLRGESLYVNGRNYRSDVRTDEREKRRRWGGEERRRVTKQKKGKKHWRTVEGQRLR